LDRQAYDALPALQWPVLPDRRQGTLRMFGDGRFYTPSGKAQFLPITPRSPGVPPSQAYPLILNTGRIRDQWHTMTRTGKSPRLTGHDTEPFVELHPQDAEMHAIVEGGLARVRSRWGEVIVRVCLSEQLQPGNLFIPMHWNDQFASAARVDSLVNPVTDPVSGQPEFKHTPVSIEAYRPSWHGFLLTRQVVQVQPAVYWSKARRDGLWHYELAGEEIAENWPELARQMLSFNEDNTQWLEMLDVAGGHYRGASVVEDRLEHCLFIGPDHHLPKRDWLVQLFGRDSLSKIERQRLLAGSPGAGQEDAGKTVCACFSVGENTLVKAICSQGLTTVESIGERLKAGTNCGSCLSEIKQMIRQHTAMDSSLRA
jgi:assimilatory nitrate reductase catalytic subunit